MASAERVAELSEKPGFNYDESNVPNYSLPDPLVKQDGSAVLNPDEWYSTRRPELLDLFRENVYGHRPETTYSVSFEMIEEDSEAFDGQAVGRTMSAEFEIGDRSFSFPFVVFIPKLDPSPVPAIIHINNRYAISLDQASSEDDPFWPARNIVERGYATASFFTSDVDPDSADGYVHGIRSFLANGAGPTKSSWRSLSAWGWAGSRILDYLEGATNLNKEKVAIVGHSRGGKAALWSAAEDERFTTAYSNNSGCGGAALSRRQYGETVKRITTAFPHWFSGKFSDFADREDELPVDQHELIGLIAPRSVYVTSADEDLWADPKGEYQALVEAAFIFALLGEDSISEHQMPSLDSPRVKGRTGYHIRSGGHNLLDQDWDWFMDFLEKE